MIWFKLGTPSRSANELLSRLNARRLSTGLPNQLQPQDLIVNWGSRSFSELPVRQLNRCIPSKREAIRLLSQAHLRTVQIVPDSDNWLVRDESHRGGRDLLKERMLVLKEPIVEEYRVHSFKGHSLRTAAKVPSRPDHHPWIRSHLTGWKFSYRPDRIPKGVRPLAHQAVAALGMDFGAVDLGRLEDGSFIVLEVNSAPGLEGQTFDRYERAIREESERLAQ